MDKKDDIRMRNPLLNEEAQKMVWLVEERGLGMSKWRETVDKIAKYIQEYIKKEYENHDVFSFTIPKELLKEIDIAKMIMVVSARHQRINDDPDADTTGSHSYGSETKDDIFWFGHEVTIRCIFDDEGNVYKKGLYRVLYHELNHMYEAEMSYDDEKGFARIKKSGNKYHIPNDAHKEEFPENDNIRMLIYRFLSDTERNAFITDLYGELKAGNVSREDFNKVLPTTDWYQFYKSVVDNYENIIYDLSSEEVQLLYSKFKKANIKLNIVKPTVWAFKNALKHKIQLYLDEVIKKAGKIASLWFDEKEDMEERENANKPFKTDGDETYQRLRAVNEQLDEDAQKMAWLVEERGLAAAPWEENIKEIIDYVEKYVKEHYKESNILEFSVPKYITNKIDLFESIYVDIRALMFVCKSRPHPVGKGRFYGKNGDMIIEINCFFDPEGNLYKSSLYPTIYHEFNHMYHSYISKQKYDNFSLINRSTRKYSVTNGELDDKFKLIKQIIYRLFSDTERNAFICNLYGELKAKNIDRSEFNDVFHSLNWYNEYKSMKDVYFPALMLLSDGDCAKVYNAMMHGGIKLKLKEDSPLGFIDAFAEKTSEYLKDVMKKAGKIATLWFDEKEAKEDEELTPNNENEF